MMRLAELANGHPRIHVVICIMNAYGDGVLAIPLIRYVIDLFGQEHVTLWAAAKYGPGVFSEFETIFVPIETHRYDKVPRKDFTRLQSSLPPDCQLYWVSLNSYECLSEQYAIHEMQPECVWEFGPDSIMHIRRERADGPLIHRRDQYFRVIGESRMPSTMKRAPTIDVEARAVANGIRRGATQASKRLIAIHAETVPEKEWPDEYWREVFRRLADSVQFVLLGRREAIRSWQQARMNALPGLMRLNESWAEQVAVIGMADGFIGIDSCFAHVADAFGIPGVVLFGPTSVNGLLKQWGPINPRLFPVFSPDGNLHNVRPDTVVRNVLSALRAGRGADD